LNSIFSTVRYRLRRNLTYSGLLNPDEPKTTNQTHSTNQTNSTNLSNPTN
jgi:hypothetical protein